MTKKDEFDSAGEEIRYISFDQAGLRARDRALESEGDLLAHLGWDEIVWEVKNVQHNEDSYTVILRFRRPAHKFEEEETGLEELIFDLLGNLLYPPQVLAWPSSAPQTKLSQVKSAIKKTIPAPNISNAASVLSRHLGIRGPIRRPSRRPTLMDKIEIVQDDIAEQRVDAIANAANNTLLGGAGVDGAIHRAAGPQLLEECRGLRGCPTGEAKITRGYNLPARWVIHTVGPVWEGGGGGESDLLVHCYQSCLALADQYSLLTIAFPAISTGAYRFPMELATRIAVGEVSKFLGTNSSVEKVTFVCFNQEANRAYTSEVQGLAGG